MSNKKTTYAVVEHMATFQGEGDHMGRPCYFIRLYGCSQSCHFCDSAGTWHKDYRPVNLQRLDAVETANLVTLQWYKNHFVVITGGEPSLYDLEPLTDVLHERGFKVHVETSGIAPITDKVDWITLSPKVPYAKPPIKEIIERADELKFIVENVEYLDKCFEVTSSHKEGISTWLHPEWSLRNNPAILKLITDEVKNSDPEDNVRAGFQVHKLFKADAFDPNSAKEIIPLGGNPLKGSSQ